MLIKRYMYSPELRIGVAADLWDGTNPVPVARTRSPFRWASNLCSQTAPDDGLLLASGRAERRAFARTPLLTWLFANANFYFSRP